jgi:hypothetical protein
VEVGLHLLPDGKVLLENNRWRNAETPDGLGVCLLCCGPQIALEEYTFKQLSNLKVGDSGGEPTN